MNNAGPRDEIDAIVEFEQALIFRLFGPSARSAPIRLQIVPFIGSLAVSVPDPPRSTLRRQCGVDVVHIGLTECHREFCERLIPGYRIEVVNFQYQEAPCVLVAVIFPDDLGILLWSFRP